MTITKLIKLFEQATGFKAVSCSHGYRFEIMPNITAEISLAEIKRQCKSYCDRCISDLESEAAFCDDYDHSVFCLECADNWRKTLDEI